MGDSITAGVTVGSSGQRDAQGGYPGRLARLLAPGVRVFNRGVGGSTAAKWRLDPRSGDGARWWPPFKAAWADFPYGDPPPGASSILLAVVQLDRPDLIIILLGVNDLYFEGRRGPQVADEVADRLDDLHRQALGVAPAALLATALPSRRDPSELRDGLNRSIRSRHPDYLPFGERFAAAGWERLLADEVHPNEQGYQVLAEIAADELRRRGLVSQGDTPSR